MRTVMPHQVSCNVFWWAVVCNIYYDLGRHTHNATEIWAHTLRNLVSTKQTFFNSWMCLQNVKFSLSFYSGSSESLCISKFTQKHISTLPSQHPVLWPPIKGRTTILFISGAFLFSLLRSQEVHRETVLLLFINTLHVMNTQLLRTVVSLLLDW